MRVENGGRDQVRDEKENADVSGVLHLPPRSGKRDRSFRSSTGAKQRAPSLADASGRVSEARERPSSSDTYSIYAFEACGLNTKRGQSLSIPEAGPLHPCNHLKSRNLHSSARVSRANLAVPDLAHAGADEEARVA